MAITILVALVLLFLSAAFSGLNIGLMMARPEDLQRKAKQGDKIAARVYQYRKNGNYLITCILLGNVSVISAMSIVLESVAGGIVAGLLTTALVTAFGEIIPQSLFSRKGYHLTKYFFWLLDIMFLVLWPIAKPVSILLDKTIGQELPSLYTHEELTHMVHDHANHDSSELDHDESRIVAGALEFSKKTVQEVGVAIERVVAIDLDDEIDAAMVSRLRNDGHSRFPVKNSDGEYVGILYIKDILGRTLPSPVGHVYRDKIHTMSKDTQLDTALSRFIQTKSHLFMIEDDEGRATGLVTLEDIIEEIIKREIEDEFDADADEPR